MYEDEDDTVRRLAVRALGRRKAALSEEVIVRAVGDATQEIRQQAVSILGAWGDPATIHAIVEAFGDPGEVESVPTTAAYVFGQLASDELAQACIDEAERLFTTHEAQLARDAFFGAVVHDEAARALAVAKSSRPASSAVAYLADLLTWPQWYVRQSACRALGSMRHGLPQSIVARLFELRRDPRSNAVQRAADEALVAILSTDDGAIEDNTVEMASM